jgi:HK97 family phage major capsid protein
MTPEQLEQHIKTMLLDTTKGLATKDELSKAVTDLVAEAMKAPAEDLKKAKDQVTSLSDEIKALRKSRFASIKTSDGRYCGIWPSVEMAKGFGLFVLSEVKGSETARKELDALGIERKYLVGDKALSGSGSGSAAPVIPQDFAETLIVLMSSYGVYRRNALLWPMGRDETLVPVQTSDVEVYCPGAGVSPTATEPGFKNVGVQAQKWITLTAIDSEVTEDAAIAIGEVVGRSIARAFAKKEDACGFVGDGTKTYFNRIGITTALRAVDATITKIRGVRVQATPGAWSAIVLDDLLALPGLILDAADDGVDCKWYCNKNFYYTVMLKLALAAGGTMAAEVIQTGYSRNPQFLGRPVEFVHALPKVKASADHMPLLLGNLKLGSVLGDRRQLTIEQSKDVYFTTDQVGIRGTERVGFLNHGVGGSTDVEGTEAGPIVALQADIA